MHGCEQIFLLHSTQKYAICTIQFSKQIHVHVQFNSCTVKYSSSHKSTVGKIFNCYIFCKCILWVILTPLTCTIRLPATFTRHPLCPLHQQLFRVAKLSNVPGHDSLFLSCLRVGHPPSPSKGWVYLKYFLLFTSG